MGDRVSLPLDDFLILWANNSKNGNTSPQTMRKYLDGFQQTILDQMELNGEIHIHNFGKFKISQYKGGSMMLHNVATGEMERKWAKPKLMVSFDASSVFERAINQNDFKLVKTRHRPRRYTASEYQELRNSRRRKEKKPIEAGIADVFNKMDRKAKERENGET